MSVNFWKVRRQTFWFMSVYFVFHVCVPYECSSAGIWYMSTKLVYGVLTHVYVLIECLSANFWKVRRQTFGFMSANFLVHVCEHFEKSADKHFSSCLRTFECTSTYFRVHVCGLFIKVHRQTFLIHVYMDFVQVYANKSTYFSSPQTYFCISCLHGFLQVYGDKSTKLVCGLDKFSPRSDDRPYKLYKSSVRKSSV